jgi:hypothetical protein
MEETITIRAIMRSYHVEKSYLSVKMKSLIDGTNTIHSSAIYYAISDIVNLLPLKEEDITPEILRGGADEDTIEAFRQASQWELPLVCKILKQRILNDPLTDEILLMFRDMNDSDYPKLLEKYLLSPVNVDIKWLIEAHESKHLINYQIMKQRILNEPLTRESLKAFREVNDTDYPQLLKTYLLQTVDEDNIYGDIIKEYQILHENRVS